MQNSPQTSQAADARSSYSFIWLLFMNNQSTLLVPRLRGASQRKRYNYKNEYLSTQPSFSSSACSFVNYFVKKNQHNMKFHASYSKAHALRLQNSSFRCFSVFNAHPRRKKTWLKLIKRFNIYEQNTKSVVYAVFSMFLFWMQSKAFYYARFSSKNTRQNNFFRLP